MKRMGRKLKKTKEMGMEGKRNGKKVNEMKRMKRRLRIKRRKRNEMGANVRKKRKGKGLISEHTVCFLYTAPSLERIHTVQKHLQQNTTNKPLVLPNVSILYFYNNHNALFFFFNSNQTNSNSNQTKFELQK